MKHKGFTLIELLVVIGIIAVLAAILFPVFAQAREQARKTKCMNNMKQIYLAFRFYADDWDGWWPAYRMANVPWAIAMTEQGYLTGPYIKKGVPVVAMCYCPSDTTLTLSGSAGYVGRNNSYTSYGLNSAYESGKGACAWGPKVDLYVDSKIIEAHSPKVMLVDATASANGGGLVRKDNLLACHNGQANVLLTDGHVESSAPDGTSVAGKSAKLIWSYTYDGGW